MIAIGNLLIGSVVNFGYFVKLSRKITLRTVLIYSDKLLLLVCFKRFYYIL